MALPTFSISLNSVLSAISSRSLLSFLSSTIYPPWGIFYATTNGLSKINDIALNFNSVISFNLSGGAAITTAPVASQNGIAGNYSSINKVNQPLNIKMRIAVEGMTGFSGQISRLPSLNTIGLQNLNVFFESRTDIINKLEEMKSSATIYNIQTPDKVYPNFDLVDYAFVMSAKTGITLLAVDLTFQEIRTIQEISIKGNQDEEATTQQVNTTVTPQ